MKYFIKFLNGILLVAAAYGIYAFGAPMYYHGFNTGMDRILWGCDDAIRLFAAYYGVSYSIANIVVFVFIAPLLTIIACIGLQFKNLLIRQIAYLVAIIPGLYIYIQLYNMYIESMLARYGGF